MTFTVIGILFIIYNWCPVKRNKSINVDKNIFILLLSDKNRIIPRSAIDKAHIATFTTKILTNEREI